MKYCFDASSFISLWKETYPNKVFPTLYNRELKKISDKLVLIKPIFDEIKEEDLIKYLKGENLIPPVEIGRNHEEQSLSLQQIYKTDNAKSGASPVDINLIAYSQTEGHTVVTQERHQLPDPRQLSTYRIPLICEKENIPCINLVEFFIETEIRV